MAQAARSLRSEVSIRADLDAEDLNLSASPRFQRAPIHARSLLVGSLVFAGMALALLSIAYRMPASLWRSVLANAGAALLLIVAGWLSAFWVARWRCEAAGVAVSIWPERWRLRRPSRSPSTSESMPPPAMRWSGKFIASIRKRIEGEIVEALCLAALAAMTLIAVRFGWDLSLAGATLGRTGSIAGGIALLAAFGLLVMERDFAGRGAVEWPESLRMAQLVRVAILVLLISSVAFFFSSESRVWPARFAVFAGLLPAVVAVEWMLRAIASMFARRNHRLEPRLLADSLITGFLQWPPRPLRTLHEELQGRFGIDLRQNWAFAFMRRAFVPVLGVIGLIAWLLTGVIEIRMDGRGIYERFGKPVAVLGPGLHVGLPWPLSRVLPVENGVIHELATAVGGDDTAQPDTSGADDEAPVSANRLWDASHVAEKSQVIASFSNERQSFQIVNMDVRFVYRVGMTNEAALAATYNSADIPALIRSTASRVLVQDFASRTLDELLSGERTGLADDIGKAVQSELDRVASGVEILATLVEAIHPPAGAANAYHSVQAALITAQATIARERGRAAQQLNEAQLSASLANDRATAAARETKAAAEAAQQRFAAEQNAYRTAGRAFLLEQYFGQLSHGLADAQLIVLDHRIGASTPPTIDLRNFALPSAPSGKSGQ